jgi:hypothetical protein
VLKCFRLCSLITCLCLLLHRTQNTVKDTADQSIPDIVYGSFRAKSLHEEDEDYLYARNALYKHNIQRDRRRKNLRKLMVGKEGERAQERDVPTLCTPS